MFKTILKYVFCGILVFVSYMALQIYAMFSVSKKLVVECGMSKEAMDDLVRRKAPGWEVEKFTHEKYSCLNNKQNIVENFFFPVPENWINPVPGSLTYKDVIKKQRK